MTVPLDSELTLRCMASLCTESASNWAVSDLVLSSLDMLFLGAESAASYGERPMELDTPLKDVTSVSNSA